MKPPIPILVIDDDQAICDVVHLVLVDAGHDHVLEAYDGVEALAILQSSAVPMVALSDYRMPRMDGLRLLQVVTSDGPELARHRFILMSSNASRLSPAQRLLLQQHDIPTLRKPFDLERLVEIVEEAADFLRHAAAVTADAARRTQQP